MRYVCVFVCVYARAMCLCVRMCVCDVFVCVSDVRYLCVRCVTPVMVRVSVKLRSAMCVCDVCVMTFTRRRVSSQKLFTKYRKDHCMCTAARSAYGVGRTAMHHRLGSVNSWTF